MWFEIGQWFVVQCDGVGGWGLEICEYVDKCCFFGVVWIDQVVDMVGCDFQVD